MVVLESTEFFLSLAEVDTILEGRRYPIQGATPTASLQSNIRHPAFLASAVHPALYCLKHLAIELLSGRYMCAYIHKRIYQYLYILSYSSSIHNLLL